MKVKELIEMLESEDPEAEVRMMQQPSWPFEYTVAGVTTRGAIVAARIEDGEYVEEFDPQDDEKPEATVFLLEGRQVCYGDKAAWR